jgi:hypothetical protein
VILNGMLLRKNQKIILKKTSYIFVKEVLWFLSFDMQPGCKKKIKATI